MIEDNYGEPSGGETRLLHIAASLLDGSPLGLSPHLAGLGREHLQVVFTAIAQVSGCQELSRRSEAEMTRRHPGRH